MLRNYFTIAFRNLRKHKLFSLINISGLAIGISASLVIYLLVSYEFSFDKHHKDGDRIYRIVSNMHFPDQDFKNAGIPGPLPEAVRKTIPGIENSTVFWTGSHSIVSVPASSGSNSLFKKQSNIVYADDQYFRFFQYQWLAGSPENALNQPNKVVLAESRVKTYFANKDVNACIGQTILYDDSIKATVSGVVKDLEEITDFSFKEFISIATITETLKKQNGWDEWGNVSSHSQFFIRLKKDIDPLQFNADLARLRGQHVNKDEGLPTDHFLQPLADIHFNHDFDVFDQRQADRPTLYGLLAVAVFLLLLGCINFVNLTTAQAALRAKEIGIRKTMGSSKGSLVLQFLGETFLLTLLATAISLVLIPGILRIFSDFIPAGLSLDLMKQPHVMIFVLLLIIVVSLLSGAYPALILSRFKPVLVLKNFAHSHTSLSRRTWIRKTLTVSQFVIAQFFIIATLMVGKQIRYSINKDMGFRKDAIINFETPFNPRNPDNKAVLLGQKLRKLPGIEKISLAGSPPASQNLSISTIRFNKDGKEIETSVEVKYADEDYFDLYHMKLLAGRPLQQSDTIREYLVNESYAKFLGFTNPVDIVGQSVDRGNGKFPIVGVLRDINSKSVHQSIQPLVYTCLGRNHHTFHVALVPKGEQLDSWQKTITQIENEWKEVYPGESFQFRFFDDSIAAFYKSEQDVSKLLQWATGLAIFISCLGMLGLVIYSTNLRVKEIGVRKVMGATVTQVISLLSVDFIRLVGIAFVIAAPLAWWAIHNWLNNYAYRTSISWWIFLLSILLMVAGALVTLSFQTIKAALANPVESLRTE